MKLGFSRQICEEDSNIKSENPFSWNRVVSCGQRDMTKLIATFRNFAKAHKSDLSREVRVSVVVLDDPSEVLRDPITGCHLEFQNLCCGD